MNLDVNSPRKCESRVLSLGLYRCLDSLLLRLKTRSRHLESGVLSLDSCAVGNIIPLKPKHIMTFAQSDLTTSSRPRNSLDFTLPLTHACKLPGNRTVPTCRAPVRVNLMAHAHATGTVPVPSRPSLLAVQSITCMHTELPSSPHGGNTRPPFPTGTCRLAADPTRYRELWYFMIGSPSHSTDTEQTCLLKGACDEGPQI